MPYKDPAKNKLYHHYYSIDHPDKVRAARRRSNRKHRVKRCAERRAWYYANRDKLLAARRIALKMLRAGVDEKRILAAVLVEKKRNVLLSCQKIKSLAGGE